MAAIAVVAALVLGATSPVHAEAQWGSIEGTVVDEAGAPRGNVYVIASGPTTSTGTTDPTGAFRLQVLVGEYEIYFSTPDLSARDVFPGGYSGRGTVAVVAGGVTPVSETLRTGAVASGRVLDVKGKPIVGAEVRATDPALLRSELYGLVSNATTDANGRYTLTGLATGAYRLRISKPGYFTEWYGNSPTESAAKPVAVTEGATAAGLMSHLSRGGTLSGRVVINGKKPAHFPGLQVQVSVLSSDGELVDSVSARKKFSVETGATGRYVIRYCAAVSGEKATCTKKTVSLNRGRSLSGLVLKLTIPSLRD